MNAQNQNLIRGFQKVHLYLLRYFFWSNARRGEFIFTYFDSTTNWLCLLGLVSDELIFLIITTKLKSYCLNRGQKKLKRTNSTMIWTRKRTKRYVLQVLRYSNTVNTFRNLHFGLGELGRYKTRRRCKSVDDI